MLPNLSTSALSYQKGAISGIKVFSGKLRGMNSKKWVWNETTPLILTCNWRKNPVTLILIGMQQFHYGLSVNQNDWKKQFGRDKCLKLEPFQSNQFFNKFPNCFFFLQGKKFTEFCLNIVFTLFLEKSKLHFSHIRRNTCIHDTRSAGPKMFCVSIYCAGPGISHSNGQ